MSYPARGPVGIDGKANGAGGRLRRDCITLQAFGGRDMSYPAIASARTCMGLTQ